MEARDTFPGAFKYEDTNKIKNMVGMRIYVRSLYQAL